MPVDGAPLTRSGQLRTARQLARYAGVRIPGLQFLRQLRQLLRIIQDLGGFTTLFLILGNILAAKTAIEGIIGSQQYWEQRRLQIETEATRAQFYQALRENRYDEALELRAKYTRLTGGD